MAMISPKPISGFDQVRSSELIAAHLPFGEPNSPMLPFSRRNTASPLVDCSSA